MNFIRIQEVVRRTALSRSTILRLEKEGLFPKKIRLSQSTIAWPEEQVDQWQRERLSHDDASAVATSTD
jgi:prophage regulatory protein